MTRNRRTAGKRNLRQMDLKHILRCHDLANINFVRGANCYLYDDTGRKYTDFESGCWSTALGHWHPRVNRAIATQIERVVHLGAPYPNDVAENAAKDVLDIVGIDDGKCVFLSSGSEAVECGVQIARRISGRPLLLSGTNSYLAAYGSAGQKSASEWQLVDWSAGAQRQTDECLKGIPFARVGGFVFEPGGSGSESVKFPPAELIEEIARRVKRNGGVLMANEVTTGLGRTGKWFGFQHYNIQPEIVALGKCLGNGYPVSAVAMTRTIAEKLEAGGFHHVQSHQNDPLGCAVAREVIATLREEHWVKKGDAKGTYFLDGLRRLARKHNLVKEARGRGMLLALEFRAHERFSAATAYRGLLERGFVVGYSSTRNFLRFDPPLTIWEGDIALLLENIDAMLEGVN